MEAEAVRLDQQGRYTVLLGATLPDDLPLDLFTMGRALWLGVQPQLPGEAEQPRVRLVGERYALKAVDVDTLGGKPAEDFALPSQLAPAVQTQAPQTNTRTGPAPTANAKSAGPTDSPSPTPGIDTKLLISTTPKGQTSAATPGTIPATLFGMHTIQVSDWPTVSIGSQGKGTEVVWSYVEQAKGVFDWSNLDAWVSEAQGHGVSYFFSPEGVPPWAAADPDSCAPTYPGSSVTGCTSSVANIQDWDDYVTALVTRYKGKIQIYELWNEPDAGFTGTMADLVTLTTHEYNIIRAIDPAASILSPSPCCLDSLLDNWLAAGGPTGVDGISFHAYPWNMPQAPESVISYVNNIKGIAAKYGLSSKPIWDTEGSWGTASLTSAAQVAGVARLYLLLWANGVSRFYWYAWDNTAWGALWDATNGPHPAALAYQQVHNWMVGATMTTPCSANAASTWTCGFSRPGGHQAQAIWNASSTLPYTPPSSFTSYLDLAGNKHPIGRGSLMIGAQPILLVTSSGW
jgi:hypothetical protein